jgi:hypothetical protein
MTDAERSHKVRKERDASGIKEKKVWLKMGEVLAAQKRFGGTQAEALAAAVRAALAATMQEADGQITLLSDRMKVDEVRLELKKAKEYAKQVEDENARLREEIKKQDEFIESQSEDIQKIEYYKSQAESVEKLFFASEKREQSAQERIKELEAALAALETELAALETERQRSAMEKAETAIPMDTAGRIAAAKLCVAEIEQRTIRDGALLKAEMPYETHQRGKNWCAVAKPDPKALGGIERDFLKLLSGDYYVMLEDMTPGAVYEFGADYYSGRGKKTENREYAVYLGENKGQGQAVFVFYDEFQPARELAEKISGISSGNTMQ